MADVEEDDLMDVVEQYVDRFGEGPPIFDMEEEEAIRQMRIALQENQVMTEEGES